jgi:hypothetical protein
VYDQGQLLVSTRASKGGPTTAPRPLTVQERAAMRVALQDALNNPPGDLDPNALRVSLFLLSSDEGSTPQHPANLLQLSGDGLHISFSDTSLMGQRQFAYQDVMQTLTLPVTRSVS